MTEITNLMANTTVQIIAAASGAFALGLLIGVIMGKTSARKRPGGYDGGMRHGKFDGDPSRRQRQHAVRPAFTLTPGCIELYVGNLSYDVKDELLFKEFSAFGKVNTARVITNNFNGKSKGFAFVEMMDRAEAQKAIDAMNGKELLGRAIRVNEARNVGKLLKD